MPSFPRSASTELTVTGQKRSTTLVSTVGWYFSASSASAAGVVSATVGSSPASGGRGRSGCGSTKTPGPSPWFGRRCDAFLRVADGLRRAQVDAQDRRVEVDAERAQQHGQQRRPVAGVEAVGLAAERDRAHGVLAHEHEPLGRGAPARIGLAGGEVDAVVAARQVAADLLALLGLHDGARVAHRRRGDERERHHGVDRAERPRQRRAQELAERARPRQLGDHAAEQRDHHHRDHQHGDRELAEQRGEHHHDRDDDVGLAAERTGAEPRERRAGREPGDDEHARPPIPPAAPSAARRRRRARARR